MITAPVDAAAATEPPLAVNRVYLWALSLVAALGGLLFGYDWVVIGGAAMSFAVGFLWIACFLLTYTFPIFNALLGSHVTFWIYAGICAAGFLFVLRRLPETKGRTLEEIEADLAS
ncbi:MAG: MFS transporter [Opitutae bacterium]|nr:MFS transporter [Opitutae bacterium]